MAANGDADGDGRVIGAALDPPEVRKEARLAMMELANMVSVPMALNAVVRLNVPDAIWQSGSNAPLSAAEIIPLLRPPAPATAYADPTVLERLLRLLASHGVFHEHWSRETGVRRYSLTHVGRTLVPSSADEGSVSYAAYVLQHHQDALIRAWPRLHESVLDPAGPDAFARANGGVPAYAYYGVDREANALMQRAMWGVSVPFMESFLDGYTGDVDAGGFAGVETLVDVGGSSGACLQMIMKRVPSVKVGINFDLPEVVAEAPQFPGVSHVGGDMFKSIPPGDAIFMKDNNAPTRMPVLTGPNYSICKPRLKDYLNCRDLYDPIEGDAAKSEDLDDKKLERLKNKIVAQIRQWIDDDKVFHHIANIDEPDEVWKKLLKMYEHKSPQNKVLLMK